ncbi:MAG: hypothetical protein JSS89_06155 [Bacteroidetes bacterium]|nr:hypothetical protein [Bacteroidota bacterium]
MLLSFVRRPFLLAMFVLACAMQLTAEQQYINGFYRSHTETAITVLENDPLNRVAVRRTYNYDASVRIDGCSLAEVQPGTTMNAVFDTETKLLTTVQFDRCSQRVDVHGEVVSNSGTSFSLRNRSYDSPFSIGQEITITTTPQTFVSSCLGITIDISALTPGTVVSATGFRSGSASIEAISAFGQVGCPTDVSSFGTFIALSDTSVTLDVVALGRVEFMFRSRLGGPLDVDTTAFPLFACWTEPVAWSSLTEADTLIVQGQVYPDGTGTLGMLVPTRNCPPGISIAIGFNGYAVVSGRISAISDTAVQVQGILGGSITLGTRTASSAEPTLYYSCIGTPITREDFSTGDSVYVIFANEEKDQAIRQLIKLSDCQQQVMLRGTIETVSDSAWVLLSELGNEVRLAIDTNSVVYDCFGANVKANDARLQGYTVYANAYYTVGDIALLSNASIDGTCGSFESISGRVTFIDADSISIETEEGVRTVQRPAQVYVYSVENGYGDWADIKAGEAICATVSEGLFNVSTMYIFNGYTCDGRPTSELVSTKGIVRAVTEGHLEVESNGVLIRFKVTTTTQVSGAYSYRTLTPGTRVDVSSMLAEASIEPTAMSVAVLRNTTTSVKEVKTPAATALLVPNPASDVLRATSIERVRSIQIASLDGTIVASEQGSQTISVASLASGPYIAIIHDMNGTVRTQLLQVLH